MLISMITANLYACRLMGAIALNGTTFPTDENYINPLYNFFNTFETQSQQYNTDGWGFAYYNNLSDFLTQPGVINHENGTTNSNRYAGYLPANNNYSGYDSARQSIESASSKLVIGHLRNTSSGTTGVVDPHPFIYISTDGLKSLSFAHNGTIEGAYSTSHPVISGECLQMKNVVTDYLSTHTDANLTALNNSNVDSSIYFAYLIVNILDNDWDILRGLSDALNNKTASTSGTSGYNFVLSDGKDLYAYRNSVISSTGDTKSRRLYYLNFNNYYVSPSLTLNLAFVSTTFQQYSTSSTIYITIPGINSNGNANIVPHIKEFDNDEFIFFPNKGKMVSIKNFSKANEKLLVKNTNPNPGRGVWNWESFPIMRGNSDDAIRTFAQNIPDGAYIYSNDGFDYATYAINVDQYRVNKLITGWQYQNQAFLVAPKAGYKIYSSAAETAKIKGTLCENTGIGTMEVGPIYWVGYWLMNSQSLQDALGENFSKVRRVWAENWSYDTFENEAKTDPVSVNLSDPNRPMEFGKMYAIQLSQFTTPIANFTWANSRKPASGNFNMSASYFAYNQTPNYEAIDILSVTKNNMPYKEIGIFAGEKCIGATAIDQFPVQILAYTDGYEGQALTFRALNENGAVSEINPVVNTYNRKSGEYEESVLIAGDIDYQVLKIEEIQNPDAMEIPAMVTDHRCYPNPFNPSTNISFSISNKTQVQVNIYNVKGQKVKALFNGELNQGKHFLRWDGQNDNGSTVSSGIYFYRIEAGKSRINQKMMLMK